MIEIKSVSKSYEGEKYAVKNLSLTVNSGEIFGFLGPNGAGKTTTIKMINGINSIDSGTIYIDNKNIKKESVEAKKLFTYVPDSPDMFLKLKAIEYLNFIGDVYKVSSSERESKINDLTKRFDIYDSLNEKLISLSHGMRQKIILIGSLLPDTPNWILDEPMVGLDPKSSHELKEIMREKASKGCSVFFSTHVLEVAEKLCDRIGIINKGELIYEGTLDELQKEQHNNSSLEELFLELTKKD